MTAAMQAFAMQTEVQPPLGFDAGAFAKIVSGANYADPGVRTIGRPQTFFQLVEMPKSQPQLLSQAVAKAKHWTSEIAMRLAPETRRMLFRQLDRLHDPDEWFDGDQPISLDSYKSFVRAILTQDVSGRPALALNSSGILSAIWLKDKSRLVVEFFPHDRVRYLVTRPDRDATERVVGETWASRLNEVLQPFEPSAWFDGG